MGNSTGDTAVDTNDVKLIAQALNQIAQSRLEDSERLARHENNYQHLAEIVKGMGESSAASINKLTDNVNLMTNTLTKLTAETTNIERKVLKDVGDAKKELDELGRRTENGLNRLSQRTEVLEDGFTKLKIARATEEGYRQGTGKVAGWFSKNWFHLLNTLIICGVAIYTVTHYLSDISSGVTT
jgi:hypothetical protein